MVVPQYIGKAIVFYALKESLLSLAIENCCNWCTTQIQIVFEWHEGFNFKNEKYNGIF